MAAADASQHPTVDQINLLRLSRSQVVKLQSHIFAHDLGEVLKGCFVRVLLDAGDGGRQQYRVARIGGTRQGEPYTGYSFSNETTNTYLDLDVPEALGHCTNLIQLNSISNGDFTAEEYDAWYGMACADSGPAGVPLLSEMEQKCREILPRLREAGLDSRMKPEVFATGATRMARSSGELKKRKLPAQAEAAHGADAAVAGAVEKLQAELNRRKEHPVDLTGLSMDQLNTLEDSVTDYLGKIRQRRRELTTCKVCMERDVEVVLLPCKHQVMCGECATRVQNCPLCRARIVDRIFPHKC